NIPTVEEWKELCEKNGVCPYEATKSVLKHADGAVVPYVFFFNPHIRKNLLDWMKVDIEDLVVIVDEAHNLPDYLRELASTSLSLFTLSGGLNEAAEFDDPLLANGVRAREFIGGLNEVLEGLVDEFVVDEDGFVPPQQLGEDLMFKFNTSSITLKKISTELVNMGMLIKAQKGKRGGLPRSYLFSIGSFLEFWELVEPDEFLKLAHLEGGGALEAFCLDPSKLSNVLNQTHFSLHMSGTLSPLEEYRDSLGLKNAKLKKVPSPFSKENRLCLYDMRFTTAHERMSKDFDMQKKITTEIVSILKGSFVNTGVFFTSFSMLENVGKDVMSRVPVRNFFIENRGASHSKTASVLDRFKASNGGVLLSVMGGRLSEGIDFPGKEMEMAIIVGVPFPKPTARSKGLIRYYDLKFQRGWEYVVRTPAARRLAQTAGRLIRSETDRGVVILLDDRGGRFKDVLELTATETPLRLVRTFLGQR
ncbi:MAG TPA: ATP-dependent DNA helicase, partial [Euryarchaeota archaeon]|nr:ATP-dependent DNA helicase [Euryarchaeota archaeon]